MTAPDLTIKVEPSESGSVVYGALAARTSNDVPEGQLSLVLTITNNESSPVHLTQVTVSFAGPPNVPPSAIVADLIIPALGSAPWFFGATTNDNIILPVPAPATVKLELSCDGFTDPASVGLPLAQSSSPVAGGAFSFPFKSIDLTKGQYWTGASAIHGSGYGPQLFAYDLLVRVYDSSSNGWPTLAPGTDPAKNESYYIWGKPIHAMADGVVVEYQDGIAANTPPGFPASTPSPAGNHVFIQHGPDLVLYAHFQAGSLNPALVQKKGASAPTVTRGQFLGLAGNAGWSSEPHLHIHATRTTTPWAGPPRPLPFDDAYVLDLTLVPAKTWPPTTDKPWNKTAQQGLPSVYSAIWPGPLRVGRETLWKWFQVATWAWIIVLGGLMLTPGGVECIACGPVLTDVLGVVSIVLGALGIVSSVATADTTAAEKVTAKIDVKADMHH